MTEVSPKGSLPHGWIVRTSKNYPDKVYYFNINTGDSVWECPKLDPPRVICKEKDKRELAELHIDKSVSKEVCKSVESPSQTRDDTALKSAVPPTAVVVPVVQKQKKCSAAIPVVQKQKKCSAAVPVVQKQKKCSAAVSVVQKQGSSAAVASKKPAKRKSDCLSENSQSEGRNSRFKPTSSAKRKYVSPLNNPDLEESVTYDAVRTEMCEAKSSDDAIPGPSVTNESNIKDVEMRDVSEDLLNNLNDMKETVFDTTACYYIVVDTNVLVRELNLITELKDTPLDGCGPPHIFIPWVVVEELDNLKKQKIAKVSSSAGEAVRYLNKVLGDRHPRFHGQSPAEAEAWAKTYSKCNDDKILECCIGLSDKMPAEKVILLTNDKNLVNKALICNINVHNFESMMKKVKPDTKFNYEEMKLKKKNDKESESPKSPNASEGKLEERMLQSKRDICKRDIHTLMSKARLLLKNILCIFFTDRMSDAYGSDVWVRFPVNTLLLRGIIDGILKYWKAVFYEYFTEKDRRNFELLLDKSGRPEGFFGDREECLQILSTIEAVFSQIHKAQPKLDVPVMQIQDYRVACVSALNAFNDAENAFRLAEEKSIRCLLDDNWTAINHICGIILDHFKISHDLDYPGNEIRYSEFEIRRLFVEIYPRVGEIKNLLHKILDAVKHCQPLRNPTKKLSTALFQLIPSLQLPHEPNTYPFFSSKALERWFSNPQNRQRLDGGVKQIEKFYKMLEETYPVILRSCASSPDHKMICD